MEEVKPTKGLKEEKSFEELMSTADAGILTALSESNAISAITLLRIYDVLMCMYAETDEADARALIELHKSGKIRGDIPWLEVTT